MPIFSYRIINIFLLKKKKREEKFGKMSKIEYLKVKVKLIDASPC